MRDRKKQIEEMAKTLNYLCKGGCTECYSKELCGTYRKAESLYNAGYRKQSYVIDAFVERLKEMPIKYGLPLLGLSTKTEIEDYVGDLLMQFRNAIDAVASQMKGGTE